MKGLAIAVLALVFTFFSLVSLLTAPRESDSSVAAFSDGQAKVSEVGLRVTFQR